MPPLSALVVVSHPPLLSLLHVESFCLLLSQPHNPEPRPSSCFSAPGGTNNPPSPAAEEAPGGTNSPAATSCPWPPSSQPRGPHSSSGGGVYGGVHVSGSPPSASGGDFRFVARAAAPAAPR